MKKKITALLLAVIMGLSFIVSAFAADTLKRVPSTIPGTDRTYNYVENITVKIPGTNVTYELTNVYEKVGLVYEDGIPVYRFSFLEKDSGSVILKQDGHYTEMVGFYEGYTELFEGHSHSSYGEKGGIRLKSNDIFSMKINFNDNDKYEDIYNMNNVSTVITLTTCVRDDGTLNSCDYNHTCLAVIEFYWGTGCKCDNGYEYPYDLISYDRNGSYYDTLLKEEKSGWVAKDIEKIDISTLDVNYTADENYKITDGANAVANSDTKSLKITADGDFSKFTCVKVDGKTVDSSNYTASKGSTVVEFKSEYLKTLSAGKHTVEICFTDGKAATQFEVKKSGNSNNSDKTDKPSKPNVEIPNTDGASSSPLAVFTVISLSGTAVIAYNKKKRLRK